MKWGCLGGGFKDEIVSKAHTKTSDNSELSAYERRYEKEFCKPLLPKGIYRVRYKGNSIYKMYEDLKLKLEFLIVDEGPYFGIEVHRHYGVRAVGKKGWKPKGGTCCLLIDWFNCHPDSPSNIRRDRLPMTKWFESEYLARLGAVTKNHRDLDLPEKLKYSVVRELIGRI